MDGRIKKHKKMINIANMYRIKLSIWMRQLYMPGVRGAVFVLVVNLIVILTIRIVTRRMARAAAIQARALARPVRKQFAYASVHK